MPARYQVFLWKINIQCQNTFVAFSGHYFPQFTPELMQISCLKKIHEFWHKISSFTYQ